MTYNDTPPRDPHAKLDDLREELAESLLSRESGPEILQRHAHILDAILTLLMSNDELHKKLEEGLYIEHWIDMFLRVQKQCADTVKTAETVNYMKFMTTGSSGTPLPSPPATAERKEGDG